MNQQLSMGNEKHEKLSFFKKLSFFQHGCVSLMGLSIGLLLGTGMASIAAEDHKPLGLEQAGEYVVGNLGQLQQFLPKSVEEGAVYSVAPYPLYTPDLPAGTDRNLVLGFCNICHASTYINMQPPLPADKWEATVQKMIEKFGAPIPDSEKQKIIQYLQNHFTPETRGK